MHETANGTTNATVMGDLEDFADLAEPTQDRLLRSAERTVAEVAPPPAAPVPELYRAAARDAEVAVVDFFITTQGGILKSSSLSGVSGESYAGQEALRGIVAGVMGSYALGSSAQRPSTVLTNVTDEPLW